MSDAGKTIDLGRKAGAELTPKTAPEKYYPSIYLDLPKGSPLAGLELGSTHKAQLGFKVKSKSASDGEGASITLEALTLTL